MSAIHPKKSKKVACKSMPEQILWPPATIWKSLNLDWKKCNDEGSKQEEKPINGTKNKTRKHTQWRGPAGKKIDIIIHNNPTTAVPPKHETQRWWCTKDEWHDEAVHCWRLMRWGHVNTVHQIYQQSSKRHLQMMKHNVKMQALFCQGRHDPGP